MGLPKSSSNSSVSSNGSTFRVYRLALHVQENMQHSMEVQLLKLYLL